MDCGDMVYYCKVQLVNKPNISYIHVEHKSDLLPYITHTQYCHGILCSTVFNHLSPPISVLLCLTVWFVRMFPPTKTYGFLTFVCSFSFWVSQPQPACMPHAQCFTILLKTTRNPLQLVVCLSVLFRNYKYKFAILLTYSKLVFYKAPR